MIQVGIIPVEAMAEMATRMMERGGRVEAAAGSPTGMTTWRMVKPIRQSCPIMIRGH